METNRNVKLNETGSHTIDLFGLLERILQEWKKMLIVLIAGFLFVFAYYFAKYYPNSKDERVVDESIETIRGSSEYYNAVVEYFDSTIEDRYSYLYNSAVGNMNPYGQYVSTATYVVNPLAMPESKDLLLRNESVLLGSVLDYIKYQINWDPILNELNLPEEVLVNELVAANLNGSVLSLSFSYSDGDNAKRIKDYACAEISEYYNSLVADLSLQDYSLIQTSSGDTTIVNGDNFNWLTNRLNEISSLETARANFMKSYNGNTNGPEPSFNIKSAIKKSVLGAIVCLIVFVVLVASKYVLGNQVLSSKELNDYLGVKNLATLRKDKRLALIRKGSESNNISLLTDETKLELASDTIIQMTGSGKVIAVVSDLEQEKVNDIVGKLQGKGNAKVSFVPLPNIKENLSERHSLQKSDYVLLLAQVSKTKYSSIDDLLTITSNYGKPLIGTITINS